MLVQENSNEALEALRKMVNAARYCRDPLYDMNTCFPKEAIYIDIDNVYIISKQ